MTNSKQRIVLNIKADGTVSAHTEGIHGDECVSRIALLESLLEAQTVESAFTDDYLSAASTLTTDTNLANTESMQETSE